MRIMCHWDFHWDFFFGTRPSLMCLSFVISLCILGSLGECLMNYEDIMQIRYIPNIHNIHNQHKTNIINIIYIKYFSIHKLHIIHLIDIIIIICIIKFESLPNFHYVTYGLSLMCLSFFISLYVLGSLGE